MRILVDTNVTVSAIMFPNSVPAHVLKNINELHELVFSDQNIRELREVVRRKRPELLPDVEVLLAELSYELVPAIDKLVAAKVIRDATDQPILNAAIVAGVDVIVTGDKDFLSLDLESPMIMTPSEFLAKELEMAA